MADAVIVSTARTPIGKAYRGAFNDTESPTMGGHVIREAVKRAKLDPGEVEDVIMGAALQQGTQGFNVARQSLLAAKNRFLPVWPSLCLAAPSGGSGGSCRAWPCPESTGGSERPVAR